MNLSAGPPSRWPIPFGKGDTRATFLGCAPELRPSYPGPQLHLIPAWQALLDPLHMTVADWDLAPPRDVETYWDGSWWAPELYFRRAGAIIPVDYQIAMLRRERTPLLAAAMQWDTTAYTFAPPAKVTAAAIVMQGPNAPRYGTRDTMTTRQLRALSSPIPSGPAVLSLEMMPRDGIGTVGRARFGIDAPLPLERLRAGEIAVSQPVLARAAANEEAPRTITEMLARMLGTTTLQSPSRVAVFWEIYGLADHDTVEGAVRVIRQDNANILDRAVSLLGVGHTGPDTVSVNWREPRPTDPAATVQGGVTIRPRGLVFDFSGQEAGRYSLDVTVTRGTTSASGTRALVITR